MNKRVISSTDSASVRLI